MVAIRFTGNYEDLSTDRGYQFKFFCEKCNNGYMSTFKTSTMGVLGSAARVAGNLFGGVFGSVADSSYEVQRAVGGPAHDSALKDAVSGLADNILSANSAAQTWRSVVQDRPELVLLDLKFPDSNDTNLLKRIRARFPDICVVVGRWGSDDIEDDARPLLAAGANRVGATLAATRDHVLELSPPARKAQPLPRSA